MDFLILPMLEAVHSVIKVVQKREVFICDFIESLKLCEVESFRMYVDEDQKFTNLGFINCFRDLVAFHNNSLLLMWFTGDMYEEDYLAFFFGGKKVMIHMKDVANNNFFFVHRADFVRMVDVVNKECTDAAEGLISELKRRFPSHDIMNALGIVYPQF